jgi:HEAT repeat protein
MLLLGNDTCLPDVISIIQADGEPGTVNNALSLLPRYFDNKKKVPRNIMNLVSARLTDSSAYVRLGATSVLKVLGTSAQVEALKNAISKETEPVNREQMEETLTTIETKPPS